MSASHETLIEIPQWSTVTLIELIWLLAGILAFSISAVRFRPLLLDYRYTQALGEDDLCIIARGYLRREAVRVAQALCIISIGVYSAIAPPAFQQATGANAARVSLVGVVITGVLISISLLISVQSSLDWRDRNQVKRIIKEYADE